MPKWLHKQLEESAKEKGLTGEKRDTYVYGTMDKIKKAKAKGADRARALMV